MQNNTFSTLFVGQNLIKLSAVDSTNNFLKNLLSNSAPLPEGTVIMADDQFAGRGQQQNNWHAEPGKNLTISILLFPTFLSLNKQFLLNIVISVAINKALTEFIPKGMSVKWPNDIYYKNQKLGGILIENTIVGSLIKTAVVGIGINVNQEIFVEGLSNRAVSMIQILQEDVNLVKLLHAICSQIEKQYLQLKAGHYTKLTEVYVDCLYKIGELSKFRKNGVEFAGIIKGVEENGQLIVETEGNLSRFNFKEIEFLFSEAKN